MDQEHCGRVSCKATCVLLKHRHTTLKVRGPLPENQNETVTPQSSPYASQEYPSLLQKPGIS
jgi:hypothetical protein